MKSSIAAAPPPLRVFLVENHSDTRHCFESYLRMLGHEVFSAACMEEALEKVPSANCDLLISDVGLLDGTGWELMERLGEAGPTFAVAMSGYGTEADRNRSRMAGFRRHLLKPVPLREFDALLAEVAAEREFRETGGGRPA